MSVVLSVPHIPQSDRTPLVERLVGVCDLRLDRIKRLTEENGQLKDEIARLKGHNERPKIRPSRLNKKGKKGKGKRPGSSKRSKTAEIEIHNTVKVAPTQGVPKRSRFKGYRDYTVVGLCFEPHNVRYRVELWKTPEGEYLTGNLPPGVRAFGGGHFSPELAAFILHQHHGCLVPQNVILSQLRDLGVPISEGQINHILSEPPVSFHEEKEALLSVGLEVSPYIHVDDTGARHDGKNGYCTHIGNEWFAYFASTESKSRINFLSLLRAGRTDYVLNDDALNYMVSNKLPKAIVELLRATGERSYTDAAAWAEALRAWGLEGERHIKTVTEGALFASVLSSEINPELVVLSDDAGQFNVLLHALCWIHAERLLAKLHGFTDHRHDILEKKRAEVWSFYQKLKAYRQAPSLRKRGALTRKFDAIFTEKTEFASLNQALKRLHRNKKELLLVLERPEIALHNNLSENDIRDYVTRRKRSGSTRSDLGRRCRDTFTSLKKTCRKLGISFWQYLLDRCSGSNDIAQLQEIIRQRSAEVAT